MPHTQNSGQALFAALNVLSGKVFGRCMPKHRHQEYVRFLNAVDATIPAGKLVHAIVDNYATHKHPKVREWQAAHPWWTFHFTPTSASWLNAVEGYFAKLTKRRLARGVFRSVDELQAAIERFFAETNLDPNPFIWTKKASHNFSSDKERASNVRFYPLAPGVAQHPGGCGTSTPSNVPKDPFMAQTFLVERVGRHGRCRAEIRNCVAFDKNTRKTTAPGGA